jgi:3-methyladenine DNA glycosylase AlkD
MKHEGMKTGRWTAQNVLAELKKYGNPARAVFSQRYFKTGKGEYAEGDRFLGLNAAEVKQVTRSFRDLNLVQNSKLLHSPLHEARVVALLILVYQFQKFPERRKEMFRFYLDHRPRINNWDLVDCSAAQIVGGYLFDQDRRLLQRLARSKSMWDRRIAIISTFYFIRKGDLTDTFRISEMLLGDREDLIHKAVGWMLRETGKKDLPRLRAFLNKHYPQIPRTALRYAIERFPEPLRLAYLKGPAAEN